MNSGSGREAIPGRGALPVARLGFTLIELLIVITIIMFLAAMIAFVPQGAQRDNAVRAAAEELANTLRLARSYAMTQRAVCGVTFNIQNAPGTSGCVLNNHSGGHWYRIVGPTNTSFVVRHTSLAVFPFPDFQSWDGSTVSQFLSDVQSSRVGDRHVLPRRKVRFLALTDQDNGTMVTSGQSWGWGIFPTTYPRPWFGYWDAATQRLYPWGGYDTALVDTAGRKCSGFYYEGNDGPIIGSVNPADRVSTCPGARTVIFTKGAGRPLVNGEWLDYLLTFNPDGTVGAADVMNARMQSYWNRGSGGGNGNGDLGDLTALPGNPSGNIYYDTSQRPMSSYVRHTGCWSITLCPDTIQDTDRFPTAQDALASIWPAYRVTVNQFGNVQVVRVNKLVPNGTVYDTTISNWQAPAQTNAFYQGNIATTATGGLRGQPVTSHLDARILASRQWWMVAP